MSQLEREWKDHMAAVASQVRTAPPYCGWTVTRICVQCHRGTQYGANYDVVSLRRQAYAQAPYEMCARCYPKMRLERRIRRHRRKMLRDVRRARRSHIRWAIWRTS